MAEEQESRPQKRYGRMEVERYVPSKESVRKRTSNILFIILVLAIVLLGIYAFYWFQSPTGARTLDNMKSTLSEYNPLSWYSQQITIAKERTGNMWTANTNRTKTGIIFEDFEIIGSAEVPAGSPILLAYDLAIENADVEDLPLNIECRIDESSLSSDVQVEGVILPDNPVIVSGKEITENIRCRIPGELTGSIEPDTYEIKGKIKFPFQTRGVKLKVYFADEEIDRQFDEREDFFDYYDIEEDLPIRTQYNGEPVEIGIGVNSENIQPIILGQDSSPLIGITLSNRWDGEVMNLSNFKIELPNGLAINKEFSNNPSPSCPFEQGRKGQTVTEFVAIPQYIENIVLEKSESQTFECWLQQEQDILGDALYTTKDYGVSVGYNYQLPEESASVTIKGENIA